MFMLALVMGLVCVPLALAGGDYVTRPEAEMRAEQPQVLDYTDQLIVKFKDPDSVIKNKELIASRLTTLSQKAGTNLSLFRAMSGDAHVFKLPQSMSVEEVTAIAESLSRDSDILYAEPDSIMKPALAPNDTRYSEQWHYFETYGANLPAAWDITTGSTDSVVAVIDTGILGSHEDIAGRTVPGYDFINDTFVSNDGDGRDADPSDPGDWVAANDCYAGSPARDSSWHGTHVAGTIGAATNNNTGVAGINWMGKILPVRVLGKCGGYLSDIADGMRWAAGLAVSGVPANANPAQVLNLSLGGSGACGTTYQNAIDAITAAGSVVVVAAGNENEDASGHRPANCTGVITVAATDRGGDRAYYSNYGSLVEIAAPGGETTTASNGILSTLNDGTTVPANDDYVFYQGTSMATPHVAGIASLILSANPTLQPADVLQVIQDTAQAFPGGSGCITSGCGAGIIDAAAAIAQAGICPTPVAQNPSGHVAAQPVTYEWSAEADTEWTWFYVWVQNLNTGDLYNSGWVNSPDSTTWTQTSDDLPWGNYRWWVRVWGPDCGYSPWSNPLDFDVGNCAGKPILQAVADDNTQPTYDWSGSSGEWTWYNVEVKSLTSGKFYNSGWKAGADTTWSQLSELPLGTYQARVQVWHPVCGYSEWSDPVEWTICCCCDKPVLQSVADLDDQPTYDWSGSIGEWTWYFVWVQNMSTGTTYSSGWKSGADTTWTQPSQLPCGIYKAWLQVWHNECGYSQWSDPVEWNVCNCPGKPTMQTVADGEDQPNFQWSAAGEWSWFLVDVRNIATGASFGSVWVNSSANSWTPSSPLPWGTYQARVRLWHDQCGYTDWSDFTPEWTVGNCAGTPSLIPIPADEDQPTYDWSATTGEWTWVQLYVLNTTTGQRHDPDWIETSGGTWTQPSPLPGGTYKAWVRVWHPTCGSSPWSDVVQWTVPGTDAYGRFFNNLICGAASFSATLTVCGVSFTSSSGVWSSCKSIPSGTCTSTIYADAGACGIISGSETVTLDPDCVYDAFLDLDAGVPYVGALETCPGNCSTPKPWSPENVRRRLIEIPIQGEGLERVR
jgi:serine protease